MKARKVTEYEVICPSCRTGVRLTFEELEPFFRTYEDKNINCPACRHRIRILQMGVIMDGVIPKIYDRCWGEAKSSDKDGV